MPLKWGAAGGANGALTGVVPIDLDISIPSDGTQTGSIDADFTVAFADS